MVSGTISTDRALNSLSLEAHFLYMMTIPHLDRDGLILGDADVLFATVAPRRPQLAEKIEDLVQEWIKSGLVLAYDGSDGRIFYFRGFRKNNPGLRYDREGASTLPPPPGMKRIDTGLVPEERQSESEPTPELLRSESGVSTEQLPVKRREEKSREVEDEENEQPSASAATDWWLAWTQSFPDDWMTNPTDKRNLASIAKEYGNTAVVSAIDHANRFKKTATISVGYLDAILRGWKTDGKLRSNGSGCGPSVGPSLPDTPPGSDE